jgi:hypothetical protein
VDEIPPKLDYHRPIQTPRHWADGMHLWAPGSAFVAIGLMLLGVGIFPSAEFATLPVLLIVASFLVPGMWLLMLWRRSVRRNRADGR